MIAPATGNERLLLDGATLLRELGGIDGHSPALERGTDCTTDGCFSFRTVGLGATEVKKFCKIW